MSKHLKSNILFTIFLVFLIISAFLVTFFLINNHNKRVEEVYKAPYYSFKKVSKKDPIDVFAKYPINPITINFDNKASITGLKNKEVETKINDKLAKLDVSKNEYGDNFCYVNFNYSNVLNISCKDKSVTINLVDGNDIILEEIFQNTSDLLEISKDALYRTYCPLMGCEELSYDENNVIDNYLIAGLNDIKNNNYEMILSKDNVGLRLNYYASSDYYPDYFEFVNFNFYNYPQDITIFNRFLTNDNIYEKEITAYCNPQNCNYIFEEYEDNSNYQNSSFLTSKTYLDKRIYNSTGNDITMEYKYEYEDLDLEALESKFFDIIIAKYDLTKENNYKYISIDLDIYNTNYDYKLITYMIDIKEFNKEEFIKYLLGYYEAKTVKEDYIFKNNMIITKEGNIEFLEDNPTDIFNDFNNTVYDYIIANEDNFLGFLGNCDSLDYDVCLEERHYEDLIKDASYAIDKENEMIHMFYQLPIDINMISYVNSYIPYSLFTLKEIE